MNIKIESNTKMRIREKIVLFTLLRPNLSGVFCPGVYVMILLNPYSYTLLTPRMIEISWTHFFSLKFDILCRFMPISG